MNVVNSVNLISKTMDKLLDFVAKDQELGEDFQKYLENNNIELESEKEFNSIIISYVLDCKMQNGLRVLEYYKRKNPESSDIIDVLLKSFFGVFQIQKIQSGAYLALSLTSDTEITLVPMIKMMHLKQIGRYDYIKARIVELDNTQYILEIYDVISEFNPFKATQEAIRAILTNPKSAYCANNDKKLLLKEKVKEFDSAFKSYFKGDYISTTNKKIDELIKYFNHYKETKEALNYSELIENIGKNRYFNIEEFDEEDSEDYINNALSGFSNHKETYDIALFMDLKRGLYIIPFFETFLKCFEEDIEGKIDCIKEFLYDDKIPPSILEYAAKKYNNFIDTINNALNCSYKDLDSIIKDLKSIYLEDELFSNTIILYNSELFNKFMGFREQ